MNMNKCEYCGLIHEAVCPKVKSIEYNECGTVKRVEFFAPNDYMAPLSGGAWPAAIPPGQWGPAYAYGKPLVRAVLGGGPNDRTLVADYNYDPSGNPRQC
jgi:hypothetical protein